jgi:hypothetical protein
MLPERDGDPLELTALEEPQGAVHRLSKRGHVIERNSTIGKLRFKILAPFLSEVPDTLTRANVDARAHSKSIFDIQLLRGTVYREYGPIASQLLPDGRHYQSADAECWHILLETDGGRVLGCSRYRPVQGGSEQLAACNSALAHSHRYGPLLKSAIEMQMAQALKHNVQFGEAGMWALRPEVRCSTAAVNIALMTFVLAEKLGGGLGITTATTRHHSAAILRRLGGRRLGDLPAYYEPRYGCVIEILHFTLANLHTQYSLRLARLKQEIHDVDIICAAVGDSSRTRVPEFYERGLYAAPGEPATTGAFMPRM